MNRVIGPTLSLMALLAASLPAISPRAYAAESLGDQAIVTTQNSVLNMFVSVLPTMADVELHQVGRSNNAWVYQGVPVAEIGSTTQDNSLTVDQRGSQNNLFMLQIGRTNFALATQQAGADVSYFVGTDFETKAFTGGQYLRFRSGDVDIISLTPRGLTAGPSSFGRAH